MVEDLELAGAPEEFIQDRVAEARGDQRENDIEILEVNVTSVAVFLNLSTQWMFAGMAGTPTGLMYSSVEAVIRLMGLEDEKGKLFADVRVLEAGAIQGMREKAASEQARQRTLNTRRPAR